VGPELALALIRDQFPDLAAGGGPSIERIGVGWDNVAYLVAGRFVLRFPPRSIAGPLLAAGARLPPARAPRLAPAGPGPALLRRPPGGPLPVAVPGLRAHRGALRLRRRARRGGARAGRGAARAVPARAARLSRRRGGSSGRARRHPGARRSAEARAPDARAPG